MSWRDNIGPEPEQEVEGAGGERDGILVGVEGGDAGLGADVGGALDRGQLPYEVGKLRVSQEGGLVALVELVCRLPLPGADQLQVEVGEHGVEELRQLGLVGVGGLGDPELEARVLLLDGRGVGGGGRQPHGVVGGGLRAEEEGAEGEVRQRHGGANAEAAQGRGRGAVAAAALGAGLNVGDAPEVK